MKRWISLTDTVNMALRRHEQTREVRWTHFAFFTISGTATDADPLVQPRGLPRFLIARPPLRYLPRVPIPETDHGLIVVPGPKARKMPH